MSVSTVERRPPRVAVVAPDTVRDGRVARWLPWAALLLIMAGTAWLLMWAGRGTTFFYDDWPYLLERGNWNPETLLRPHNEHLQVFPLILYKILFETVGIHEHWVYRAALVALNLLTGLLLFLYARKRAGAWPAVALAACLMVMAPSWYNLVYSFQVNFVGAMAAGMAALLAMDREDRRGDVAAALLLGVSIGSSSVGFPFLIGAVVELVWRRDWRRWWVAGVPIGAYVIWTVLYGTGNSVRLHNVPDVPNYVIDGADDAAGAITGYGPSAGMVLFWALIAWVAREVVDPQKRISGRLVAVIAMPLSYWSLTALGRADMGVEADSNRYLYAAGLFVALVALELARRYVISGRVMAVLTGLLLFGAVNNANGVANGGNILRDWSDGGQDAVTAIEIAGPENVPPDYRGGDPTQPFILAGGLFDAIERYGSSPGFTREELLALPDERKRAIDETLARVLNLNLGPSDRNPPVGAVAPRVEGTPQGETAPAGAGCIRLVPGLDNALFDLRLPRLGLVVKAGDGKTPVGVRLRRYSTLFSAEPLGSVNAGETRILAVPPDRSAQPWLAQLQLSSPAVACGVAEPG